MNISESQTSSDGKILIVDDRENNIRLLYSVLEKAGQYDVLVASDGKTALQIVQDTPPDLILLDIMMPELNGFEVCKQLKADPQNHDIPVIFLSALNDTPSKLEGFAVGGVDYITQPFHQEETLARIQAHLKIVKLQRHLREQNQRLDAFAHTVAHDLKNPLGGISGSAQLAKLACEEGQVNEAIDELNRVVETANKASDIVESLLLLAGTSKHANLELDSFSMAYIMPKVQKRLQFIFKEYPVELKMPDEWPIITGYPAWIEEIWVNYISNAIKYGGHPPRIELGFDDNPKLSTIRFWVRDNGPGLNQAEQSRLFIPFTRLHTERAEGHGLGLSIVRQIAEQLRGDAGVESTPGQGSLFFFTLPRTNLQQ
jgi:signal transduction histidine kinase